MDRLWSPWRYAYISAAGGGSEKKDEQSCVFCPIAADPSADERNYVLRRAAHNFVILNLYPYTSGHLMIVPYRHAADLDALPKETTDELMDLAKRAQSVLREAYHPEGFNFGFNLGQAGGAGVAGHVHMHALPRWLGDTNFMTTVGETRVLPEDLQMTYERLRGEF
ncbi:MAG: HIT domain-containing protein [Acidobacteriota bacterium]|nr:HIT domain-containing protein [Acidobacteriota bacterium]